MYPVLRVLSVLRRARRAGPMPLDATDEISILCWPIDIDLYVELNNGRTLTLYDLGRFSLAKRTGLDRVLRQEGWGIAVAGVSIRFRRRVRVFDRLEMRTRMLGWDQRFVYIEQALWRGDTCCSHILVRGAITDASGIVAPERVLAALGQPDAPPPPFPVWAQAWIEAEALRPWPPEF
ncbi:thioeseterase [Rhodobacterales bacterium HKCCE2091]|nr:thioeseterase [Rhodobacterales bacterium HKCCE2091]